MSQTRLKFITAGILLSLFLASMEGTVVATAMPSIVGQLGGLSIYSWVFAIYMLASTVTVPIYGKLSDLYGRRSIYTISMVLFLSGSVLCGLAGSMEQLVFFRAIQGLGAGGIIPLAFTIVGEIFSLEQRARMQGLFSGVWGVSSVIGPVIGGFLVDQISWHWVFFINLFPGAIALLVVWFSLNMKISASQKDIQLDLKGVILLTIAALALLLGLNELGTSLGWWLLAATIVFLALLVWVEKRAEDPILPFNLFRDRLFLISILHGILAGWAMFGSLSYVPLFVQAVLGTSATVAGITLTPMSLSWTFASIIGSRLLLKISYRALALGGMVSLIIGAFLMTTIGIQSSQVSIMVYTGLMGIGMGLTIPAFMIAVQTVVAKNKLGAATSTIQFSRSIGGTIGVSVLGVFLSANLAKGLIAAGLDPNAVHLDTLVDSVSGTSANLAGPLRAILGNAMANMFFIALIAAALGFIAVLFTPYGKITDLREEQPDSQFLQPENLTE